MFSVMLKTLINVNLIKLRIIKIAFFFIFFLCGSLIVNASQEHLSSTSPIKRITSFQEINFPNFSTSKKKILFVDVDDVLITPDDLVLRSCDKQNSFNVIGSLKEGCHSVDENSKKKAKEQLGILRLTRKVNLPEPGIPIYLQKFHKFGIDVVGITQIETGACGPISCVEEWRINELSTFDIKFHQLNSLHIDLTALNTDLNRPCFKGGIIFTDKCSKDECISFCLKDPLEYEFIGMIDDQWRNLNKTYNSLKLKTHNFKGYHYITAKKLPGIVNPKIGQFQIDYLATHGIWLGDQEVYSKIGQANE